MTQPTPAQRSAKRAKRPAKATPPAPTPKAPAARARDDLQTLLFDTVQRLRETTHSRLAVAWRRREGGAPYVACADYEGDPPGIPEHADLSVLARLSGATDLLDPDQPEDARLLAKRQGCSVGVAILGRDGLPVAALLLDAPTGARSEVEADARAALDAAARRLAAPVAAAAALERLGSLDSELQRVDRLASLGSLISEIAHEIRNPLVSVKTFVQLLPERRSDPDFVNHFLEVAADELRRMERLLDLVVDHARPPRDGETCAVPPALDAVTDLLRQRARSRQIRLENRADGALPEVALGEDPLRQVLLNLALNAVDASPEGGLVRLDARADGGSVLVEVADEGPGIPEDLREKIFDPFFTTREDRPGGLGLAISRRLVEAAGGRVEVRDADPRGAIFVARLPVSGGAMPDAADAPEVAAKPARKRASRTKARGTTKAARKRAARKPVKKR